MPRKGENIYRRKDGRWEGRFAVSCLPGEKAKYKSVYGKTYAIVKQKLREADKNKGLQIVDTPKTYLADLAQQWSQHIQMKVKESTYSRYQLMLQSHILPHLGDIAVEDLSTEIVERYLNDLLINGRRDGKGGLSYKTVKDNLCLLKQIMQFAQNNGIDTICKLSSIALKQEKKEKEILSESNMIQLVADMTRNPEPIKIGVILCLYTGMRIGELCALRWKEIDLTNNILYIKYTAQRIEDYTGDRSPKTKLIRTSPKSKSSNRCIPLPDYLTELLRPWAASADTYFLSETKDRFIEPRRVQIWFKKYLKECGIQNISFHGLRHTFSTISLRSGMDSKTLSELLGHSNVNITLNNYVHSSMDFKRESMNNLIQYR
jgi:integrase